MSEEFVPAEVIVPETINITCNVNKDAYQVIKAITNVIDSLSEDLANGPFDPAKQIPELVGQAIIGCLGILGSFKNLPSDAKADPEKFALAILVPLIESVDKLLAALKK